jgi:DNA replication protein DnaC
VTKLLDRIRASLVGLRMPRALEALDHTLRRLERGELSAIEAIDGLLAEEHANRETRRIAVALKTAQLNPPKTLEGFDFSFQPSLDRNRILALAELDFVTRAEVLHFLGPPGTGKSHLATALGVAAVKDGKAVYRCTLAELIEALGRAEREGRLTEKLRFYSRASLLIVDEIGYLPITSGGANLFFQLVNARYEKGATISENAVALLRLPTSKQTTAAVVITSRKTRFFAANVSIDRPPMPSRSSARSAPPWSACIHSAAAMKTPKSPGLASFRVFMKK